MKEIGSHPNVWVMKNRPELTALAFEEGPKRTKNQYAATSNNWQGGHSDRAADILGVACEAYSAFRLGFNPFEITYVFPTAPSGKDADFGGVYEVKRTNSPQGTLKYRRYTNANHVLIHAYVDRVYNHPEVEAINKVYLMGWNAPKYDGCDSEHAGYDSRGEEMRSIAYEARRPMDTIPLLNGAVLLDKPPVLVGEAA